jgi:hypothetical protein
MKQAKDFFCSPLGFNPIPSLASRLLDSIRFWPLLLAESDPASELTGEKMVNGNRDALSNLKSGYEIG